MCSVVAIFSNIRNSRSESTACKPAKPRSNVHKLAFGAEAALGNHQVQHALHAHALQGAVEALYALAPA